jgi:Mg-chelatase subunit ChlI
LLLPLDTQWAMGQDRPGAGCKSSSKLARQSQPSVIIIDSQSVKLAPKRARTGFDGNKRVKGRKHHPAVDAQGLALNVFIGAASVPVIKAVPAALAPVLESRDRVQNILADQCHRGKSMHHPRDL